MRNMKTYRNGSPGALAAAAVLLPAAAPAQSVGDIGDSLATQAGQVNTFVTIQAFALGAALAIAEVMTFYSNSKKPNDPSAKMSTAVDPDSRDGAEIFLGPLRAAVAFCAPRRGSVPSQPLPC